MLKSTHTTHRPKNIQPGLVGFKNLALWQIIRQFLWIWLTFILALYLSWMVLAQHNFLYGIWYDFGGIKENVASFAPQNKFRQGFAQTDDASRKALFAGIVQAIHHDGQGLRDLNYTPVGKHYKIPLLHRAEIEHLTDVAQLINFLKKLGWGLLLLWCLLTTYQLMLRQTFPSLKTQWKNLGAGLVLLGVTLAFIGPTAVFYQLHRWIFPANHQWFFYYQDSLMSTMMKAPDLFAYIGLSLLLLGMLFFSLLNWIFTRKAAVAK